MACQAAGCEADLAVDGKYSLKRRLCRKHLAADWIVKRDGEQNTKWRFCQQCGKLELLSLFEGDKRSCSMQLARRRQVAAASKRCRDTNSTYSDSSGGEQPDEQQQPTSAGPVHQMSQGLQGALLGQVTSPPHFNTSVSGTSGSGAGAAAAAAACGKTPPSDPDELQLWLAHEQLLLLQQQQELLMKQQFLQQRLQLIDLHERQRNAKVANFEQPPCPGQTVTAAGADAAGSSVGGLLEKLSELRDLLVAAPLPSSALDPLQPQQWSTLASPATDGVPADTPQAVPPSAGSLTRCISQQQSAFFQQELLQAAPLVAANPAVLSPVAVAHLQMAGSLQQFATTLPGAPGNPHGIDHSGGVMPEPPGPPGISFAAMNKLPQSSTMASAAAEGTRPSTLGPAGVIAPADIPPSTGILDLLPQSAMPSQAQALPPVISVPQQQQQPLQEQLLRQQWQSLQQGHQFQQQRPQQCLTEMMPATQAAQQAGNALGAAGGPQAPEASTPQCVLPGASVGCSTYAGAPEAPDDMEGAQVVPLVQFRSMASRNDVPLQSVFASAGTARPEAAAGPDVFAGAAGGAPVMMQAARVESLQHATRDSFMSILNRLDSNSNALSLMDIQNTFDNLSEVLHAALEDYPALTSPISAGNAAGGAHDDGQMQQQQQPQPQPQPQPRAHSAARVSGSGRIMLELEEAWDGAQ